MFSLKSIEKALVLPCFRSKKWKKHWFYCVFAQNCWKTIGFTSKEAERYWKTIGFTVKPAPATASHQPPATSNGFGVWQTHTRTAGTQDSLRPRLSKDPQNGKKHWFYSVFAQQCWTSIGFILFSLKNVEKALVLLCFRSNMLKNHWYYLKKRKKVRKQKNKKKKHDVL